MANIFTNVDDTETLANIPVFLLASQDRLTVGPDAVLSVTGANAPVILASTVVVITVAGDLFSLQGNGITTAEASDVTITADGSVAALAFGVRMNGEGNEVNNAGSITAEQEAVYFGGRGGLNNDGIIVGRDGVLADGFMRISNTGIIRSTGSISEFSTFFGDAIEVNNDGATIFNSGSILATFGDGISAGDFTQGPSLPVTINNTGMIAVDAGRNAIVTGAGDDVIFNAGTIIGDAVLSNGNDLYSGGDGLLQGRLEGDGGNDTLVGGAGAERLDGGEGDDEIFGGNGRDALFGDAGADMIEGGEGDDVIEGGSGVDFMDGGAGYDALSYAGTSIAVDVSLATGDGLGGHAEGDIFQNFEELRGGSGNDTLAGGNGADRLVGNNGADILGGNAGNDRLDGGAGNDTLFGNAGADLMRGGLGADTFRYITITDSTPLATGRDRILDFNKAELDIINLFNIDASTTVGGNQAFAFIGAAAFSSVAGQLRYATIGQVTYVLGDVNGDAAADLSIQLAGAIAFAATDFVL